MKRLYRYLRRIKWKYDAAAAFRSYRDAHTTRCLQVGGGPHTLRDWFNTDLYPWRAAQGLFHLDATRRLPFPDNVFARVFTEHMVEHLEFDQACAFLREAARILEPGGRIRVCTPDLEVLCRLHQPPLAIDQQDYIATVCREYQPGRRALPGFAINQLFDFGHAFLFDASTLGEALRMAGFSSVVRERSGESHDPLFRGIDAHASDYISFETLVLEACKSEQDSEPGTGRY